MRHRWRCSQLFSQGASDGVTGPGITCDYLDVEGPLYDSWPPTSHKRLFGSCRWSSSKRKRTQG
ncbi:MAG: hypothetical protein U0894_07885 [Pirellulales bacterium]